MTLKKYYATPPNYRLISFSFRAWIGLIWEISARAARQNAWNFGARLFWNDTTLSEFKDIRYIKVFLDAASEKCSCPSMYILGQEHFPIYSGSRVLKIAWDPVFPGSRVLEMGSDPVFPGSRVLKMARDPVFPGSKLPKPNKKNTICLDHLNKKNVTIKKYSRPRSSIF